MPTGRDGKPGFRRLAYPREATVRRSCNGLLLLEDWGYCYVFNPATGRYAELPRPSMKSPVDAMSLAFDPAVSLHFDVFVFEKDVSAQHSKQAEASTLEQGKDEVVEEEEEEPREHVLPLELFSSRTWQWEKREFMPGHCAPGNLYDILATTSPGNQTVWSSEYWRGSLYMHCHYSILTILRPSKGTYDMVRASSAASQKGLPRRIFHTGAEKTA